MIPVRRARRAGLAAAVAAVPLALAYRFALVYRVRAGYPRRHPPVWNPDAVGLAWEDVEIPTIDGLRLPGWYFPAGPGQAPGVVLVHGWESARDRMLGHAQFLHAAGFHVLTFDVRGNGENPAERLPMSVGEYAADARAAVSVMAARPEVTGVGILGHSMGAAGALVAAAGDASILAVVALAAPADPARLTRQTFRLAQLPIPGLIAWPLAWLTTWVYLRPRNHTVRSVSAGWAIRRIAAPVLLVHGSDDRAVPVEDMTRLARRRMSSRPEAVTETLVVEGGRHSWLYEFPEFRSAAARFLAGHLGGGLDPDLAAIAAAATPTRRLPDPERPTVLAAEPGGFRSLARLVRPSESRLPTADPTTPDDVTPLQT